MAGVEPITAPDADDSDSVKVWFGSSMPSLTIGMSIACVAG